MAQIKQHGRGKWLIRVYLGRDGSGKQQFRNRVITGTKEDAKTWAQAAERDRDLGGAGVELRSLTVSTLLDDLQADYRINAKSFAWVESVARVHLRPALGDQVAARVGTDTLCKYVSRRQKAGAANGTINRELALLRRAFNLAHLASPPKIQRVPRFPMLKENNVRKGFLEDAQYCALLAALPDHLKPVVAFAYFTGCRYGEIVALEWRQVDLARGLARLDPGATKNDDSRVIPLANELRDMLLMQKARRDAQFPRCRVVFFGETGESIKDMRTGWASACRCAGLVDDQGKPTVISHDLRRTGVRNLVRAGVPERVAMAISGHKTRAIFDRYNITSEADLLGAAVNLQAHIDEARRAGDTTKSCNIVAPEGSDTTNGMV